MRNYFKKFSFGSVFFWLLTSFISCQMPVSQPASSPHPIDIGDKTAPDVAVYVPAELEPVRIFPKDSAEVLMWKQFFLDGRYRLAQRNDFKIPEAVEFALEPDIRNFTHSPCSTGDFNGDGATDLACLVIDKEESVQPQFGILIMNGVPKQKEKPPDINHQPRLHWLYRHMDLSGTVITYTLRGGLEARQYQRDKSFVVCSVKWNPIQRQYYCTNPIKVNKR